METTDSRPGWFFSPPVGPSISDASLTVILDHIKRDDDYWSSEAPATAHDYCRENWAPLIYSDGIPDGLRASAEIYYIERGKFTVSVRGTNITDYSAANDPETGERLDVPAHWLDAYPVVSAGWDEYMEVSRQGNRYRYPTAVTLDREQVASVIGHLYAEKSLWPGSSWITEMEYARKFRRWFYVSDE